MLTLSIIWWNDIPMAVVVKKSRRELYKCELDDRFQIAIDSAATAANKTNSDEYINAIRKTTEQVKGDDLKLIALNKASELEKKYTDDVLKQLIEQA